MSLPRPTRKHIALAAATLLAIPLVAIPVALIVLVNTDWNRLRPWLNERISESIDRPFAIRGDLSLTWEKQSHADQDRNWHDYLPLPHLVARDVHVGDPAALQAGTSASAKAEAGAEMASVGQFSFSIDPFALLAHRIAIPVLRFETPLVHLRRNAGGDNNWTFKRADKPSAWTLELQRVVFTKGSVTYVDALTKVDAGADIDTINADPQYGVSWRLHGSWRGQPISGSGKAGAILSLQQQTAPFPLAARLDIGATRIDIVGTLTKPTELAALDLRLKLSGASMARLYALTGVLLPETPPFVTEGHLAGTLGASASHWIYDGFTGKVGSSDIAGKLDYQASRGRRPQLNGALRSTLLQFSDLGPLVGADSNASKQARGADTLQPGDRALPVEVFHTERWTALNADVAFKAERLVRDKELPIHNIDTRIVLQDGVLALKPLDFDIAGGKWNSTIVLDGSGKVTPNAIRAELKASARRLKLKQLFPRLDAMQATVGEINADVSLSATGNSVARLLGSSNGELKGVVSEGSISKLVLEEMGLNIGSVVLTKLVGDKQIKLNCLISDFSVTKGLMHTRTLVADTDEAMLRADGTINLDNEKLDLTLHPESKGWRLLSLRAPIYVRGSFKRPDVSVDKGVLALRAGGALALAVVAPVAALLPLVHAGDGPSDSCAALLAQRTGKAVAPPPGKLPARTTGQGATRR